MRKLILLMLVLIVPIAFAIPECGRFMSVSDIPCNIISSWKPSGNCGDYNLTIYNSSGEIYQITEWGNYTPVCNTTFNITVLGTYYGNSTPEDIIITIREDAKIISAVLVLIPLIMAIVFMIASFSQSEKHSVLRIYMFLMSLIMFFFAFHFGMLSVVKFMDFPEMQNLIGSTVYWYAILFGGVLLYFLIYMIYVFVKSSAEKKQENIEY